MVFAQTKNPFNVRDYFIYEFAGFRWVYTGWMKSFEPFEVPVDFLMDEYAEDVGKLGFEVTDISNGSITWSLNSIGYGKRANKKNCKTGD